MEYVYIGVSVHKKYLLVLVSLNNASMQSAFLVLQHKRVLFSHHTLPDQFVFLYNIISVNTSSK